MWENVRKCEKMWENVRKCEASFRDQWQDDEFPDTCFWKVSLLINLLHKKTTELTFWEFVRHISGISNKMMSVLFLRICEASFGKMPSVFQEIHVDISQKSWRICV